MNSWDPETYHRFRVQRRQPFVDLLGLLESAPGMRVVDLGCGTGELTRAVHDHVDAVQTLGIDSSAAMLAEAQPTVGVRFEAHDIAAFEPAQPLDLVFSNAALQWVPDHGALFGKLSSWLAPGGQIAVHVPANFGQPTHTVAAALAGEEPFAAALGGRRSGAAILRPEQYAELLFRLGFERQRVTLHVYLHRLPGPRAVLDWLRGSYLTWYESQLGPELFGRFVAAYEERLLRQLPTSSPYPFTYNRILMWGRLPGAG